MASQRRSPSAEDGPPVGSSPLADGAAHGPAPTGGRTALSSAGLTSELLLRTRHRVPAPGWRRTVYRTSLGLIRVPPTGAEMRRLEQIGRVRTAVAAGHHRVAVMSLKGGVGKTTITIGLGSMLASLRGDRIIALDANPGRGTLADKLTVRPRSSVRDLLARSEDIWRYADVRAFTTQTPTGLEVIASDQDPASSAAFTEADYDAVCAVLERYYSVCLTDCGTGLLHSAMTGALRSADQIVLVTTASLDAARSGSAAMDWLAAHGHHELARNAVVVLNAVRRPSRVSVDLDRLHDHFAARSRAVVSIPYDRYLEQGGEVELDQLARETGEGFLALAAVVGDGFAQRRADIELTRQA
ncbi:MAG TPA: MinD/ParA family protein [Streptosporangiaceae bacterium]|nr:MinD/ParA family protein [Streptosporangiaceae bacterium]